MLFISETIDTIVPTSLGIIITWGNKIQNVQLHVRNFN